MAIYKWKLNVKETGKIYTYTRIHSIRYKRFQIIFIKKQKKMNNPNRGLIINTYTQIDGKYCGPKKQREQK